MNREPEKDPGARTGRPPAPPSPRCLVLGLQAQGAIPHFALGPTGGLSWFFYRVVWAFALSLESLLFNWRLRQRRWPLRSTEPQQRHTSCPRRPWQP